MRGREHRLLLLVTLSVSCLLSAPPALWAAPALAYIGPGPGLEFIPSFFALLAWMGFALGAVLLWPVSAVLRFLRGGQPRIEGGVKETVL